MSKRENWRGEKEGGNDGREIDGRNGEKWGREGEGDKEMSKIQKAVEERKKSERKEGGLVEEMKRKGCALREHAL